ncbi:MAG TPA: prenyltransferase/squalene oxidase repeat-containing protein [Planctomycetota bacterium]|nr:prenyltransferase/squalene oxidase repeat-containing protein [Planctomycetota bacterium]
MAVPENVSTSSPAAVGSSARPSWLKRIATILGVLILVLAATAWYLWTFQKPHHSTPVTPPKAIVESGDKVLDSIRRGVEYLKVHQEANGEFSKGLLDPKPGFTALVVDAIARSPDKYREKDNPWLKKATDAIKSYQRDNGAISTPAFGLDTYTTAVSVLALTALENPEHAKAIERAKGYLLAVQYKDDETSETFGAPGYTPGGRTSGDLASYWVEALKEAGVKEGDPAFENAKKFLSRLQNNPETNDRPAPDTELDNDGGFIYRPGESKPADGKGKSGKRMPRSYGLMSYAGLKSFLYMNVGKDDPRVQSAWKWVRDNYTLEENRNIGADGLYYYFLTMAKALTLYGEPVITTSDGKEHRWAQELSDKLISLQNPDGSWSNRASARWMENDAVMVTGYAIRTLTLCHEELKRQAEKKPADTK